MDRDLKDFQYSMKYRANRVYIIVVTGCLIIGSCAQWKAKDRYHIGPDPTIRAKDQVDDLGLKPTDYPDYEETIREYPNAYVTAEKELVEARWQPIIDPEAKGLVFAIEDLIWIEDNGPLVMT